MRDAAIAIMREIGVETGGSNVQFAIHPDTGEMIVIEMNPPRLPLLRARLQGDRLSNRQDRRETCRRIYAGRDSERYHPGDDGLLRADDRLLRREDPRWTFEKFPETEDFLTTSMKSVGETMAIGRTFREALQKAIRSWRSSASA